MADKKDLRGCMEKMREVALFLNEWADDMEAALDKKKGRGAAAKADVLTAVEDVSGEERTCLVQVPGPAASVPMAQDSAPAVQAPDPSAPTPDKPLTAQEVHDFLRDKCAAGFRTQVEALINSFGAEKFSGVAPEHYAELMKAAAALGAGDGHAG